METLNANPLINASATRNVSEIIRSQQSKTGIKIDNLFDISKNPLSFEINPIAKYSQLLNTQIPNSQNSNNTNNNNTIIKIDTSQNDIINTNPMCKDKENILSCDSKIDTNDSDNDNSSESNDEYLYDDVSIDEIYDMICSINDPEHPLTLEQLNVVSKENISFDSNNFNKLYINFTPTIPHCSMATLIGLCIRVKLMRSLPRRFKVNIKITKGTHQSEDAINKQLNDKERVAAAMENPNLINVVNRCILTSLQK